jgi:predicted ribosomally synthesized peptide with SipW-like signal peptide
MISAGCSLMVNVEKQIEYIKFKGEVAMKRKILLLVMIIGVVSILSAGTLAFFTAEEKAVNRITSGNIDIELLETTDQMDEEGIAVPFKNMTGVMPGTTASKNAELKNSGEKEAYVRAKVDITMELDGGTVIEDENTDLISINFNLDHWTLLEDEYYYYNYRLKPGEITEPLFTQVSFSETMGNDYQSSTAMVGIRAYAVQVDNNGKTVFEAMGWPEDSSSEN